MKTLYQVYAKKTDAKGARYRNVTGTVTDEHNGQELHGTCNAERAERFAKFACKWNAKVKVIVTDTNGVKNEIIYK